MNLIDTPGHVDFSYEVERSLAACEGAVLLVDSTRGIQAQTLSHARKALGLRLKLVPAINKIDLSISNIKQTISQLKETYPAAEVLAHPECSPEVCAVADFVGSTSNMFRQATVSKAKEFIVATEVGLLHRLRKEKPDGVFIPAYNEAVCAHMKLNTLEKLYLSLRDMRFEVKVPPEITDSAREGVEFMLGTNETLP